MIGNITYINGLPYFELGESDQGYIFKDEEAYKNNWFLPCYVAEHHEQEDEKIIVNGSEYDCGGETKCWYSHMDILQECKEKIEGWTAEDLEEAGIKDAYDLCDMVFQTVDWQHPSTYLQEIDY